MKSLLFPVAAATILTCAAPAAAQDLKGLDSVQPSSSVSIMPDPVLQDGRLVLRVAAKNSGNAAVTFGSANVQVTTAGGRSIAVMNRNDVIAEASGGGKGKRGAKSDLPSAYSGPQMVQGSDHLMDVSNYTGGMASTGGANMVHEAPEQNAAPPPAGSTAAALDAALLKEGNLAPGQMTMGQVVTEKMKLKKNDGRALHVVVTVGGDSHSFDFPAPPEQ
jgi:hypothetical protein